MNINKSKPNIIIIYADDLGFGDVSCYGATDIQTPNIDKLSKEGIQFNRGYASAATCTPSRYSLLTGSYPWRNKKASILTGDAAMIIDEDTTSIAQMFKDSDYKTAVVGKWHLGLGNNDLNWNVDLTRTPNDIGFDYSYIMAATNDRVPCVYVENRRVDNLDPNDPIEVTYNWDEAFTGEPTGRNNPELLKMKYSHGHDATIINGVSRIGHMRGGKAALWDDETMSDVFAKKACSFIEANKEDPFFLFYALHQPHVPRIPNPRFVGSTKLGPRGDVIVELDWCVGEILKAVEQQGLKENTMIIFSSDNGPVLNDGYIDQAEELKGDHKAAGPLRGGKYSLFDGGTRVPFILSWPSQVAPSFSDALVCQIDFYASFAELSGYKLNQTEAPDSENVLKAFLGTDIVGREELLVEGIKNKNVYQYGVHTYIPPYQGKAVNESTKTELGNSNEPQLYDLSLDIGQISNIASAEPQKINEMDRRLNSLLESKHTR
jgi:arylsulfatase A-like enzyme